VVCLFIQLLAGGVAAPSVPRCNDVSRPTGPFSPFSLKMFEAQCATRGVNSLGPRRDTIRQMGERA
jgi:hypothetical protein